MSEAVNVQNVTNTTKVDQDNDVAGAANVQPSYIAADVDQSSDVAEAVGVDSVSVSTNVNAPSAAAASGMPETQESNGYIQTDLSASAATTPATSTGTAAASGSSAATTATTTTDTNSMDTLNDVISSAQYINPNDPSIQQIISTMKSEGLITAGMSDDQIASAVYTYVTDHFSYIADKGGDTWSSVGQTIANGGGDCEDLSNLTASLMIAAFESNGMSASQANSKVNCVVSFFAASGVGHVIVEYNTDDGKILYYDPTNKTESSTIRGGETVLFTYNANSVDILDTDFNWSVLRTSAYFIDATPTIYLMPNYQALGAAKNEILQTRLNMAADIVSLLNILDDENPEATLANAKTQATKYYNAYMGFNSKDTDIQMFVNANPNWSSATLQTDVNDGYTVGVKLIDGEYYCTNQDGLTKLEIGGFVTNYISTSDWQACKYDQEQYNYYQNIVNTYPALITQINAARASFEAKYNMDDAQLNVTIQQYEDYGAVTKGSSGKYSVVSSSNYFTDISTVTDSDVWGPGMYTETTSFIDYIIDIVSHQEQQSEALTQIVLKACMVSSILSQTALIASDKQAWTDLNTELSNDEGKTFLNYKEYDLYANHWTNAADDSGTHCLVYYTDEQGWQYKTFSSEDDLNNYEKKLQEGQFGDGFWFDDFTLSQIRRYEELKDTSSNGLIPQAYATWQAAILEQGWLTSEYQSAFGLSASQVAADITTVQNEYVKPDPDHPGYYEVNWTSPAFQDATNVGSIPWQIQNVKGELMILSVIYEARRDLRNLVGQEMGDQSDGYKGMGITQLFQKKVDALDDCYQQLITNVLDFCYNANKATADAKIADINADYDKQEADIWDQNVGFCADDTRQRQVLQKEQERIDKVDAVEGDLSAVDSKTEQGAQKLLTSFGGSMATDAGAGGVWGQLSNAINGAMNDADNFVRATTDTSDDPEYKEMDSTRVQSWRDKINGAINIRRMYLMAQQAYSDMRNLAHQEMTGIGGRQRQTGIAADMDEAEGKEILGWFDSMTNYMDTVVSLNNQIRKNELQKVQNQQLIDKLLEQEANWWEVVVLQIVAVVLTIVAMVVPGAQALVFVSMALEAAASEMESQNQKDLAQLSKDLEIQAKNSDMKPTPETYTAPPAETINSNDPSLAIVAGAENANNATLAGMTSSNYIHTLDDGWKDNINGSSIFDSAAFAQATEGMSAQDLLIMVANTARDAKTEMRNLVHEEMTSIGGRQPSNMVTYVMEAARGQQAFVANGLYSNLMDLNTANNIRYQRDQMINMYTDMVDNATAGMWLGIIPVFGSTAASMYTNLNNLYSKQDMYEEEEYDSNGNKIDYNTSAVLNETELNDILKNGTVDSGNGTVAVNSDAIATAISTLSKAFVAAGVEASIMKTLREIKELAHEEMTGIKSYEGDDLADQANMVNFQTAMQSLQYVYTYLTQKATLMNRSSDAQSNLDNIQKQIDNSNSGILTAILTAIVVAVMSLAGGSGFFAALQLAGQFSSFVWSITSALNEWAQSQFASDQAKQDLGALQAYMEEKTTMDSSVNSNSKKLEDLEQQCIDEITANLLQSLGNGYIGVNSGMAAEYKSFLTQIYNGTKTIAKVAEAQQELRSEVNAILTGISSVVSKGELQVLDIKLQAVKARIDQMFHTLESVAERWNQITDAQRAALKAQMAAENATTEAVIQGVMLAISVLASSTKESKENDEAHKKLDADKKAAIDKPKDTDLQAQVKTDEGAINGANGKIGTQEAANRASQPFNDIQMGLQAVQIVMQISQAYTQKALMTENDAKQDQKVSSAGVTAAPKSSKVISANAVGGDWGTLAASMEDSSGQEQLVDKKNTYALHEKQDDADLNNVLKQVRDDLIKNKSISVAQRAGAFDALHDAIFGKEVDKAIALKSPEGTRSPADVNGKKLITPEENVKALKDLAKAEKLMQTASNPQAAQTAAQQVSKAVNTVTQFNKQVRQANSSNALAYADQLLSKMEESAEIKDASPVTPEKPAENEESKKPTIQELRDALQKEQAKLADAQQRQQTAIRAANEAQSKIKPAELQLQAAQIKEMENEKKRMDKIGEIENKLADLDKLIAGQKDEKVKNMLSSQRQQMVSQLNGVLKGLDEFEKLQPVAAEVQHNMTKKELAEAQSELAGVKGEIGTAKARIGNIIAAISQYEKESKKDETKVSSLTNGNKYNSVTEMFKKVG